MPKVEIKPGYAVKLADGHIMFALASANINGIEDCGPELMDIKVKPEAVPEVILYGWDEDHEEYYWPMLCYNDNLEAYSDISKNPFSRDPDSDIVAIYGYGTPMTMFDTSEKAMAIRPVLWDRNTESKTKPESKYATYEDAKKAIEDWKSEIDASNKSDAEKKAELSYVGFIEMLTDIVHLAENTDKCDK